MAIVVSETEIKDGSSQYAVLAIRKVADLTALKALSGMGDGEVAVCYGKGLFYYDSSSAETADDVVYVDPTVGTGQWILASAVAGYLSGSTTWNPASLADGAGETTSLTVTGAELGDFVIVAPPYDMQDIVFCGYVQAANTVEIRIQNESGGVVDLASGTWKVRVFKQ